MPYLIDGSNLGGALGGHSGARDRGAVVQRILPWTRRRRQVTLVFDGPPDPSLATNYGGLKVVFGGSRSADTVITERVRKGSSWVVVTNDRELRAACVRLGARVLSTDQLLAQLSESSSHPLPGAEEDPKVDVEDWESFFSHKDDSTK